MMPRMIETTACGVQEAILGQKQARHVPIGVSEDVSTRSSTRWNVKGRQVDGPTQDTGPVSRPCMRRV